MQGPYLDKQIELLKAYQTQNPTQPLWDEDEAALKAGEWPQYYIGAVPYCFALPQYTANVWPPPAGSNSPNMGQSPGTHWYHAHKHGSTAINVGNGMTGVFIIEGQYDTDLNTFYSRYQLRNGPWNIRAQPVMVLNQLMTVPRRLSDTPGRRRLISSVNGRLRPVVQMQPGEIQLWRIANTSGRSAAYFQAPVGLQWRQIAQDGVQFYQPELPRQLQPSDLRGAGQSHRLAGAGADAAGHQPYPVLIQNVMARDAVLPTPVNPTPTDPNPGTPLLSVVVIGPAGDAEQPAGADAVHQPGSAAAGVPCGYRGLGAAPEPLQQQDADFQLQGAGRPRSSTRSTASSSQDNLATRAGATRRRRGMDDQEHHQHAESGPGLIDHPFHIHINPFQITELFDPNENMTDPRTGQLIGHLVNGKTVPIPQYVVAPARRPIRANACSIRTTRRTWRPCRPPPWPPIRPRLVGRVRHPVGTRRRRRRTNPKNVIPGYFKMRSRFVDYRRPLCAALSYPDP